MGETLGRSGATIRVVDPWMVEKTGGDADLQDQAMYMIKIGDYLCPRVYHYGQRGYWMERLLEIGPSVDLVWVLQEMLKKLRILWKRAPIRPSYPRWEHHVADAVAHLDDRMVLIQALAEWYPEPESPGLFCATHGDPTLANAMFNTRDVKIVDALPPRPHAPSMREVDLGKMLQSCLGWEALLHGEFDSSQWPQWTEVILQGESPDTRRRAWLWAAVHCARVTVHGGPERSWGFQNWSDWAVAHCVGEVRRALGL